MMRIFTINLLRRQEKKAHILREGEKHRLNIEFIEAVDGAKMTDTEIHAQVREFPECGLTRGEIGCALSHLKVYKKMIDENCPIALILEDDVVLGEEVVAVLQSLMHDEALQANRTPEVVLLSGSHYYVESGGKTLAETSHHIFRVVDAFYAFAYVINLQAAKTLYGFLRPVVFEADRWGALQQLGVVSVRCIMPAVVRTNDDDKVFSDLEDTRAELQPQRKAYLKKLKKQWPLSVKLKKMFWKLVQQHFLKIIRK